MTKSIHYEKENLENNIPDMRPGDTIKVAEKILEKSKKKSQIFEGVLISKKHGKGINATFTLRSLIDGVGVEKTYPLHSPLIEKIQVVKKGKARRAKLYYIREKAQKQIRKKLTSQRVIDKKEVIEKKSGEVKKAKEGIKKIEEEKAEKEKQKEETKEKKLEEKKEIKKEKEVKENKSLSSKILGKIRKKK
jgi:large subunit ribosomal protein L19